MIRNIISTIIIITAISVYIFLVITSHNIKIAKIEEQKEIDYAISLVTETKRVNDSATTLSKLTNDSNLLISELDTLKKNIEASKSVIANYTNKINSLK